MTPAQLEAVCAKRGFDLALLGADEASWENQDYVEAAQQCLEMEAEMKRLLQERDDMFHCRTALEAELAA